MTLKEFKDSVKNAVEKVNSHQVPAVKICDVPNGHWISVDATRYGACLFLKPSNEYLGHSSHSDQVKQIWNIHCNH